ncbi:unnamed protein product [Prorocentrum cordatum]|uniref:RNase H type-1 domain-containing protein n=1 Tax=Prorocentrum cordatum TaxID=2364126 RepID=A0ABN9REK4_9DINO|nr:unnamed protein product [Polarella glacialis]
MGNPNRRAQAGGDGEAGTWSCGVCFTKGLCGARLQCTTCGTWASPGVRARLEREAKRRKLDRENQGKGGRSGREGSGKAGGKGDRVPPPPPWAPWSWPAPGEAGGWPSYWAPPQPPTLGGWLDAAARQHSTGKDNKDGKGDTVLAAVDAQIRSLEGLLKADGDNEDLAKALAGAKAKREQHLAAKRAARPKGIQLQQLDDKITGVSKRIAAIQETELVKLKEQRQKALEDFDQQIAKRQEELEQCEAQRTSFQAERVKLAKEVQDEGGPAVAAPHFGPQVVADLTQFLDQLPTVLASMQGSAEVQQRQEWANSADVDEAERIKRKEQLAGLQAYALHLHNSSLSWRRLEDFLQDQGAKAVQEGRLPIVLGQEHGKAAPWFADAAAGIAAKGWRVLGAPAKPTEGGSSAGVSIALPTCLTASFAPGQTSWDISPPGGEGRLAMAVVTIPGLGAMAIFSVYMVTCMKLDAAVNAQILDVIAEWVIQLRIPWVVGGDWNNRPDDLERSPWNQELRGCIKATAHPEGTCKNSQGDHSTIDFFWLDCKLGQAFGEVTPHVEMPFRPHRPCAMQSMAEEQAEVQHPPVPPLTGTPSKDGLDAAWSVFCDTADSQLQTIFGMSDLRASKYKGRGQAPRLVEKELLPKCPSAVNSRGPAWAWRWLSVELSWIGVAAIHVVRRGLPAGSPPVLERRSGDEVDGSVQVKQYQAAVVRLQASALIMGLLEVPLTVDVIRVLEGIKEAAKARAQEWEVAVMRDRSRKFREKLDEKYPGSAGLLHKVCAWRAAWLPPRGSVSKAALPAHPQQAVEQEAKEWGAVWQAEQGPYAKLWVGQGRSLGTIDTARLRKICRAYKERAGVIGWHPRHWSWLSDDLLEYLGVMLEWCEQLRAWPTSIRLLVIFILGKTDGGGRPICLLPTPVRIWEGSRAHILEAWEAENSRDYDWAAPGKSSEQAVWRVMLDDEAWGDSGFCSTSVMLDVTKAYEHVSLNLLWVFAIIMRCPLDLVGLALEAFSAPRYLRREGAVADAVTTLVGLPAGSKYSNKLLKVFMFWALGLVLKGCPLAQLILYVDDITLRLMHSAPHLRREVMRAVRFLIVLLEQALGLPLARGPEGKCVFVASTEEARGLLQAPMLELGIKEGSVERWLGIDYNPQQNRKNRPTRQKRLATARHRWRKAAWLRRRGIKVRRFVSQGVAPSLAYGATCEGTPPHIQHFLAAKLKASRAGSGPFRSATINAALEGDLVAETAATAPLLAWAKECWDHKSMHGGLQRAWARQQRRLAPYLQGDTTSKERWAAARGPAAATILTCRELGWRMVDYHTIDTNPGGPGDDGSAPGASAPPGNSAAVGLRRPELLPDAQGARVIDMLRECPKEVAARAKETLSGVKLDTWVASSGREVLRPRPWLAPLRQLQKKQLAKGWTKHHRNAAKVATLGGYPEQRALFAQGRAESPDCPLCGQEEGSNMHLYWRCAAPQCQEARAKLSDHNGRMAVDTWTHGRPNYRCHLKLPAAEQHWGRMDGPGIFDGRVATDGSVVNPSWVRLRAGGWTVVMFERGELAQGLWGPLPVPATSSLVAELWALAMMLQHAGLVTEVLLDNQAAVDGLLSGRARCCNSAALCAHLWTWIWDLLDERDLSPGVSLAVVKVKSHTSQKHRAKMDEVDQERYRMNDAVDKLAKQGAQCPVPEWAVALAKSRSRQIKRVMEYVASFRVLLAGVATAVAERRGPRHQGNAGRRPPVHRGHELVLHGTTWRCRHCKAHCRTQAGKRKLDREECRPAAEVEAARANRQARRRRQGDPPPPRRGAEGDGGGDGGEGSPRPGRPDVPRPPPAPTREHRWVTAGDFVVCRVCGAFYRCRARRALDGCTGKLTNAPRDQARRRRRDRLLDGRNPYTGVAMGGEVVEGRARDA